MIWRFTRTFTAIPRGEILPCARANEHCGNARVSCQHAFMGFRMGFRATRAARGLTSFLVLPVS